MSRPVVTANAHHCRRWAQERRRQGLCPKCGGSEPVPPGQARCSACAGRSVAAYGLRRALVLAERQRQRAGKRALGLCVEAGCEAPVMRYSRCLAHRVALARYRLGSAKPVTLSEDMR